MDSLTVRFCLLIFLTSCLQFASASNALPEPAQQKLIQVGPNRSVTTIAGAAILLGEEGIVEVDAGEYRHDVAVWTQKNLKIRAIGGRVKIDAAGAAAEGKGIWVIRGGDIEVDGFDFINASVPDRNGAGIRFEKGHLLIRNSTFSNNQNGILTGGDSNSVLEIENCEFGHNGFGDGQSHNLYVGAIARLRVTGSYFHHAKVGHLLKSRAAENHIFYNRLTDETGGKASYELELPNGGLAYLVGNLIQQSSTTENPNIVSYGAEGNRWPNNTLYLINNTLVDNRPQNGVFLRMKPGLGSVIAVNNLLVGHGKLETAGPGDYRNNFNVDWDEFVLAVRENYRLKPTSRLRGKGIAPPALAGVDFRLEKEYLHPRSIRKITGASLSPGAYQD